MSNSIENGIKAIELAQTAGGDEECGSKLVSKDDAIIEAYDDGTDPDLDIDLDMNMTMEDIERALDPRTPALLKLRDRIVFVLGVLNVGALAFFLHGMPWFLPWYYMVKAPILIFIRIYSYFQDKFQYFLMDFCYWANLLLLVQLIFFPHSKRLFMIAYASTHGPLIWAVGLFKNALVFHSMDKTISAFIHISPYMVCYTIRWFHDTYPGYSRYEVCEPDDADCASFLWTAVVPLGFYAAWMLCYGIIIKFVFPLPDESYLTSYRYLTRKNGPLSFLRPLPQGWVIYAILNVIATFLFLCPVILLYRYQVLDFVYGLLFVTVAIWNGAAFYIEVFSKKYDSMIQKELGR